MQDEKTMNDLRKENPIEEGNETTPVEGAIAEAAPVRAASNILVLGGEVSSGLLGMGTEKPSDDDYVPALIVDLKLGILLPNDFAFELAKSLANMAGTFKVKANRGTPKMTLVKGGKKNG